MIEGDPDPGAACKLHVTLVLQLQDCAFLADQ
jgi:hypothetical protein